MLIMSPGQTIELVFKGTEKKPLPDGEWASFRARPLTGAEWIGVMDEIQRGGGGAALKRCFCLVVKDWANVKGADDEPLAWPASASKAADMLPGDVVLAVANLALEASALQAGDREK